MIFVAVGGYFVCGAINRALSGYGSGLDQVICYGAMIGLVILTIWAMLHESQDQQEIREAQQAWKRTCKLVALAIVSRQHYAGGIWEDEIGIPHTSRERYDLNLELTNEQRVLFPNLHAVRITVNETIYSKLIDRTVVRVYYQPDSPLTFLLEEEIK